MTRHGVGIRMLTGARDYEGLAELITEDHLATEFTLGGERYQGLEDAWNVEFVRWLTAFPDLDIQVTNAISTDTIEFAEGVCYGTHLGQGPYEIDGKKIEPTGKTMKLPFASVYDIRDGKASRVRHYWDDGLLLRQLGITEPLSMSAYSSSAAIDAL